MELPVPYPYCPPAPSSPSRRRQLILSSLVLPPRTLGKLLTVVTTLAAAFNVAMNLLRHGDELNAAILACHEGRMPFLLLAVAAGALLGAGPSMPAPLHSAWCIPHRVSRAHAARSS